ncbi:TPA: leucine efflux protein LeuE [Klebsiella aerogenes]|nr:leucine efflux protein LeuE [Klebsiella aerogenes]
MLVQYGINDLWTYLAALFFIIIVPGPNSLYVLRTGATGGFSSGYRAVSGVITGDAVLIFLSFTGLAAAIKSSPVLFTVVRLIGAFYLLYLGVKILYKSFYGEVKNKDEISRKENIFLKALMLSLTNPKAILFYISFFIQFINFNYPHPGVSYLILALILEIASFIYLTILIICGATLTRFFSNKKIAKAGNVIIGIFFSSLAIKLIAMTY